MKRKWKFAALVCTAGLLACATPSPVPTPNDSASGGIAIKVKTRAPIKIFASVVPKVIFARLEGKQHRAYISRQTMASNYTRDGYVYLLNAPPGQYVAVTSFVLDDEANNSISATNFTTHFSGELIKATQVKVVPGSIAFMGEFVVDTRDGFVPHDNIQLHYAELKTKHPYPGVGMWSARDFHYSGTLHEVIRDHSARERFRASVRENLAESGWLATE